MTTPEIAERTFIRQNDRSTNEQDRFLDYCVRNQVILKVFLESGKALIGIILDHDRKALLLGPLRSDKDIMFIEKSYISLVRANERLPLFLEYKGKGNTRTRSMARKEKARAKAALKNKGSQPKVVIKRTRSVRQKCKPP